jgi:hypothetical protein
MIKDGYFILKASINAKAQIDKEILD